MNENIIEDKNEKEFRICPCKCTVCTSQVCTPEIYRLMFDHFLQQDTLYWNFMYFFISLQLGILAGGYYLWDKGQIGILSLLCALGFILNIFLWCIVKKTEKDRMCNKDTMLKFENKNGFSLTDGGYSPGTGKKVWSLLIIGFCFLYFVIPSMVYESTNISHHHQEQRRIHSRSVPANLD